MHFFEKVISLFTIGFFQTDKEHVFTSTPTKDKNKEKEFPQVFFSGFEL